MYCQPGHTFKHDAQSLLVLSADLDDIQSKAIHSSGADHCLKQSETRCRQVSHPGYIRISYSLPAVGAFTLVMMNSLTSPLYPVLVPHLGKHPR